MYELTLALGIIAAILAFAILIFGGIASKRFCYVAGVGHLACVLAMTICCLVDSYSACALCAAFAGGSCGGYLLSILIWKRKEEVYYEDETVRLWFWIFVLADLASCVSCFFGIFNFMEVGIVCLVLIVLGGICLVINKKFEIRIIALNVIFCAAALVGSIVGFVMYGASKQPLNCIVTCEVYEYDEVSSQVGENVSDRLESGEYYAVRFGFQWQNLMMLANNAKEMRICVNFPTLYPSAVKGYISEGLGFNSNPNSKNTSWTYTFTADLHMEEQFFSGYFIVNYTNLINYEDKSATLFDIPFEVQVYEDTQDELILISGKEFMYTFRQNG